MLSSGARDTWPTHTHRRTTSPWPCVKCTSTRIWRRARICHNPVARWSKVLALRRQHVNWGSRPAAVNLHWAPRHLSDACAYAASVANSVICARIS